MHKLFMVWFWHDGEEEPLAFFVNKLHAESFREMIAKSGGRYSSARVDEISADFYAVV